MTESVQLFQRASGTWVLGCSVSLQRHIYTPLCRVDVPGLYLWCKECAGDRSSGHRGTEHLYPWLAILMCMEQFVGREAFRQVLGTALEAMSAPRTVTWRAEE